MTLNFILTFQSALSGSINRFSLFMSHRVFFIYFFSIPLSTLILVCFVNYFFCFLFVRAAPPQPEVLSSTSRSDPDSEVETKAKKKRKEKPDTKPNRGTSSKLSGSSHNSDDRMFQIGSTRRDGVRDFKGKETPSPLNC